MRLARDRLGAAEIILPSPPPPGIVHLGMGNFHRAHLSVYTAQAVAAEPGPWGIRAHTLYDQDVVDAITAQDGLYSVTFADSQASTSVVPNVHTAMTGPQGVPDAAETWISDATTRIVTLTITERGYCLRTGTRTLDPDDPDIAADIRSAGSAPARTALGQLAVGLLRRYRTGASPITVMSCDNIAHNSQLLSGVLDSLTQAWELPDGAGFRRWLASEVAYPTTMVDRIVPRPDDRLRAYARTALRVEDQAALVVEPFGQWVIEDAFAAGRPAWDAVGAQISSEVDRHEELKLTVLNGSHLALAYGGLLRGLRSIPDAAADDRLAGLVRQLIDDDLAPVLRLPTGESLPSYTATLFQRWSNRVLSDPLARVGELGWLKIGPRFGHVIARHLTHDHVPLHVIRVLADYAACITTGAVETPPGWNSRNSTEHVLDIFNEIWREMPGARERVGTELRAAADRTLGKR